MDLSKLKLGDLSGEHFLRVDLQESVAQVLNKLRDHQCCAAVFCLGQDWKVLSAELLPLLLLKGPEALQQPVAEVGQTIPALSPQDGIERLKEALGKHAWVAIVEEGQARALLSWASWARFTARHRLTKPYLFSPEWGRNQAQFVKL